MSDSPKHELQSVDWLVGAALMIRRETWQEVGLFDEQFFMYSDEVDWCRRCRDRGWEIYYLPTAKIIHHEKGTSRNIPMTSRARFHRSRIRYFNKYFGSGWAKVIRLFLLINYLCYGTPYPEHILSLSKGLSKGVRSSITGVWLFSHQ